ncbi:MAG: response regulator [Spirochaetes bacterium]|nr:response regulator [Spirochaetota bacterium]
MIELMFSILSAVTFFVTFIILFVRVRKNRVPLNVLIPLAIIVCFYALVSCSNILEHSGISSYFDPLEDISEILFTLIFLFFINNWNHYTTLLELKEKENWLRSTIASIADGVIITDNEGHVTHLNKAMENLTGLNLNESLGQEESEVLHFVDSINKEDMYYRPSRDVINGEARSLAPGKYLLKSADGRVTPISENTTVIKGENASIAGTVGIYRDMSEYESMNAQLTHIHKMEAIGQLAGGVAHDLNNVLGGIIGAADILLDGGKLDDEQKEIITLILKSSSRAADLTKNLLAFSRKGKILSSPVVIHDIINTTISIAEHTIDRQIVIDRELPDEQIEVIGDPGQLQNAFLNLLLNARDAISGPGKIIVSMKVQHIDDRFCAENNIKLSPGDYAVVTVSDTGSGIPEEIKEHIFEPFFTTKHDGKGTGLGLSAVYGTVMSHHGAIVFESKTGSGTRFNVYLPLYTGSTKAEKSSNGIIEEHSVIGAGKILIIEDDDVLRTAARLMLQDMGLTVITASNGKDGIEIYKKQKDDIKAVLLDIVMPEMNGIAVFAALKEIDPSAAIIMTSGFSQEGRVPKEADGFLPKPYRKHQLSRIIKEVLDNK